MNTEEVQRLASLARIAVTPEEATALSGEIEAVLAYVSVVDDITAETGLEKKVGAVHNVFREDKMTNESSAATQELLDEAPATEGRYLKVLKILHQD